MNKHSKYYLLGAILLFAPTLFFWFQGNCNFYNDYLTCFSLNFYNYQHLNFYYLLVVFLILILSYYNILRNKIEVSPLFIIIVAGIFYLTVPFGSTDIFYYRGVAKGEIEQNINPYKGGFTKDLEFIEMIGDPMDKPVMYPPLWLQINKSLYWLAPNNEIVSVYLYKGGALLAYLLCTKLFMKIDKVNYKLFALNPLVLFELVTNAHLDAYFILFLMIGVLALAKNKPMPSIIGIFLASLIKFNAIFLLPIFALYLLSKSKNVSTILKLIFGTLIGVFIVVVTYLPYWFGMETLEGISKQADWPFNSIFERLVFTRLNPFLYIFDGKYNSASFLYVWLILVAIGGMLLLLHITKNLGFKKFKELILFRRRITLNSTLFYSGLLMYVFSIFGLRYFLPWYLLWSTVFFMFSKFKNKHKVLALQTLVLAIYYPAVYIMGHFNVTTANPVYPCLIVLEILLTLTIFYYIFKSKVKLVTSK